MDAADSTEETNSAAEAEVDGTVIVPYESGFLRRLSVSKQGNKSTDSEAQCCAAFHPKHKL
jgi:hypothetical protein